LQRNSLAVLQAETLRVIEDLEKVVVGLRDVDAGVLRKLSEDLQRLRQAVLEAQSSSKWRFVMDFLADLLARIAAELLNRMM
jgi:dGTP triphosphohydrolase